MELTNIKTRLSKEACGRGGAAAASPVGSTGPHGGPWGPMGPLGTPWALAALRECAKGSVYLCVYAHATQAALQECAKRNLHLSNRLQASLSTELLHLMQSGPKPMFEELQCGGKRQQNKCKLSFAHSRSLTGF